jgi:hypothetical protein
MDGWMACVITDASGQRGTTPHTHADTHAATLLDAPDPTTWAAAPPALAPGAGGCGAEEDMAGGGASAAAGPGVSGLSAFGAYPSTRGPGLGRPNRTGVLALSCG